MEASLAKVFWASLLLLLLLFITMFNQIRTALLQFIYSFILCMNTRYKRIHEWIIIINMLPPTVCIIHTLS